MTCADDLQNSIAQTCRSLAAQGLVLGTAGNVSVRFGEHIAITATGAVFESMTREDIVLIDSEGTVISGRSAPTSELELHLGVYRQHDAGAVVHTHAPAAIGIGLITDELPCIHYQMLLLGGAVRVAPFATFGTTELADHVLAALSGRTAALMANHGAVTIGPTLQAALDATTLLEWASRIYLSAAAAGTPRALDSKQQEDVVTAALQRNYGTSQRAANDRTVRS
jgi:L-fuculose-phosphate aldolase